MFTIWITMISMMTHMGDVLDYINNYHSYFKGVKNTSPLITKYLNLTCVVPTDYSITLYQNYLIYFIIF